MWPTILLMLFANVCLGQKGFPTQFQATINISGSGSWDSPFPGVKQLLYDYDNLRIRFDIQGHRDQQKETWILKYKPSDAEPDSVRRKQCIRKTLEPFFVASITRLCYI